MKPQRLRAMRETWLAVFSDSGWRDEGGVWHAASPFTATEQHVALTLATYMSANGDSCFPSIPRLAAGSGRSDSTVRDALNRIVEFGFLERQRKRGRGHSNEYVARIPDYFDWQASAEENRRRAAVFASGHEQLAVGPVVKPVSDAPSEPSEKSAGVRRFSEDEKRRSPVRKPPVSGVKTAGVRRQLVQEGTKEEEHPLSPAVAGDGEEGVEVEGRMRYQLELALTGELGAPPATRSEKRDWENVVAQLLEVGATATEIRQRCHAFRETWPTAALRPLALVRHWSFLGGKVELAQPGATVERWVEQTGWRMTDDVARELLFSRDLPAEQIELHLERCRQLRAERQAGEQLTNALVEGRRVA